MSSPTNSYKPNVNSPEDVDRYINEYLIPKLSDRAPFLEVMKGLYAAVPQRESLEPTVLKEAIDTAGYDNEALFTVTRTSETTSVKLLLPLVEDSGLYDRIDNIIGASLKAFATANKPLRPEPTTSYTSEPTTSPFSPPYLTCPYGASLTHNVPIKARNVVILSFLSPKSLAVDLDTYNFECKQDKSKQVVQSIISAALREALDSYPKPFQRERRTTSGNSQSDSPVSPEETRPTPPPIASKAEPLPVPSVSTQPVSPVATRPVSPVPSESTPQASRPLSRVNTALGYIAAAATVAVLSAAVFRIDECSTLETPLPPPPEDDSFFGSLFGYSAPPVAPVVVQSFEDCFWNGKV